MLIILIKDSNHIMFILLLNIYISNINYIINYTMKLIKIIFDYKFERITKLFILSNLISILILIINYKIINKVIYLRNTFTKIYLKT